jgi:alpha-1,6-mannosyltransferase
MLLRRWFALHTPRLRTVNVRRRAPSPGRLGHMNGPPRVAYSPIRLVLPGTGLRPIGEESHAACTRLSPTRALISLTARGRSGRDGRAGVASDGITRLMKLDGGSPVRLLLVCALPMEAALLLMHLHRDPAEQVALVLASYVISGAAFAWLLWRLRDLVADGSQRATVIVLVAAAVVFRLTLLPLTPATSQDVQRYLWEGLVQLEGYSPYVLPPSAEELGPLAEKYHEVWCLINHPDVPAVYPPVAQFLFLCNAAVFGGSLLGWKLILLIFDGLLALGVVMLLRDRSQALVGLTGVLWCPLLLIECYEGGHLDVIGAALMVLTIVAMSRGRPILAALALGLCINVKYIWPLLLLILLSRETSRWRGRLVFIMVTLAVAAAGWIPYRASLPSAVATLRMFAEHWTFNDVIFELVRMLPGPRWLPMMLVTGVLAAWAGVLAYRRSADIWRDAWLLTGTALLLGPVAYPWYFIWIVPGLAHRPPLWLVVWLLSVPALHVVDWQYASSGRWEAMPWLWYVVGAAPAILLARACWCRLAHMDESLSRVSSDICGHTR